MHTAMYMAKWLFLNFQYLNTELAKTACNGFESGMTPEYPTHPIVLG